MFSVLFIAGMLGHHFTNRRFIFAHDYWTVELGEEQEGRYAAGDGLEGRMLTTAYYSLNKGDYVAVVDYTASGPSHKLRLLWAYRSAWNGIPRIFGCMWRKARPGQ